MMTRSQLLVSVRTPSTPSRGLPTAGRTLVVSPIMFYHEDSPHMTTTTVNITSTSQGYEAIIIRSRGSQDLPTDPIANIENVDLRDYYSDSEGEGTTTAKWQAQVESRDHRLAAQDAAIAELKAMIEQLTLKKQGIISSNPNLTIAESIRPAIPNPVQEGYTCYTPEYAFATLLGPAPAISVTPNIPTPQGPPMQGFPQGLYPQETHQAPHHQQEPSLHGLTPP